MTTAIEQAKREMYQSFENVKNYRGAKILLDEFENSFETYLEQLRQQYEEMASTAHSRFESIQSLEAANQKCVHLANNRGEHIDYLTDQLAKMTESRDMFRNLHQAATHASIERAGNPGTTHQDSGDRASCEQPDAKTVVILSAIVNARQILDDYAIYGRKAKKQMERLDNTLNGNPSLDAAMMEFEKADGYGKWFINNDKCMHSFFAICSDQMKCTFCGVGK